MAKFGKGERDRGHDKMVGKRTKVGRVKSQTKNGPAKGEGTGGGPYVVSADITPPTVLSRVEPQYSEEARRARCHGTVALEAVVKRDGTVDILRVVRGLGFGLDENAVQALKQWRFKPGTKNVPIDVALNIEVNFNLR